ncbi:glycosyltransferase [Bradyrhizobium sp. 41S5]|uniref:glycosyltransferase n=1 Tax=Bradyrhizobium sp. 41S5 TaxID=1404443 RepID=UPI00156B1F8B|nr:glycosyltransferase [Bradyrhizobium sp. 41S5]
MRYFDEPAPITIAAKRKALCRAAQGEIIVRFDDDDYYAPHYVDPMLVFVQQPRADSVKIFGSSQRPYGRNVSDLLLTPPMLYCA